MSESNTYSEGGMGRFKIGCVKDHLIEWGNCYESGKSSRFY